MGHGGKRAGAGRKKGVPTRKTQEIAARATAEGITPLEVMLMAMREHYEAGRLDEAARAAKDAAPYMHPRLAAVEVSATAAVRLELVEEIVLAPQATTAATSDVCESNGAPPF